MSDVLTSEDLIGKIQPKIYNQDYSPKQLIEGIKLIEIQNHTEEDGDFSEIIRIGTNGSLEAIPDFKLMQLNRTKVNPGMVKAWHLHLKQDVIWYVSSSQRLFVGLWDVRKKSKTAGMFMRLVLGETNANLLYIPKGIAHGSANFTTVPVDLYYIVNRQFNKNDKDEKRIPKDAIGKDFWLPLRDS